MSGWVVHAYTRVMHGIPVWFTHSLLGALTGFTIFLGLPIARWKGAPKALRAALAQGATGILIFLTIEIGSRAMELSEEAMKDSLAHGLGLVALLFGGIALGLIGLAWVETRRTGIPDALQRATIIALGIGLHNFSEGLAIGQEFGRGNLQLGTVLVLGFAAHNATEGFGIAGPLAGVPVAWSQLFWLGLLGGGPTFLGALMGGIWTSDAVEVLFLSLATGSLLYVIRELLRLRTDALSAVGVATWLVLGLALGFGTEAWVEVAQSRVATAPPVAGMAGMPGPVVRIANGTITPGQVAFTAGTPLQVMNADPSIYRLEGTGLLAQDIAAPPNGSVFLNYVPTPGRYHLIVEGHPEMTAVVTLLASARRHPVAAQPDLPARELAREHQAAVDVTYGRSLRPVSVSGRLKVFRLTAAPLKWELEPGVVVRAWGYNGQVPGPTIRVRQGDVVRVEFTNHLPEPTTVHWHGIPVPNDMDGVPNITQKPIPPGGSFIYQFVAKYPGTYIYHTHYDDLTQLDSGLYGAIIIDPPNPPHFDREYVMLISSWRLHGSEEENAFSINGKSYPWTIPMPVRLGDRVRVRMINISGNCMHVMHLHGHLFHVIAKDGTPVNGALENSQSLSPGETYDVAFVANNPGIWMFHCHIVDHMMSANMAHMNDPGGLITLVKYVK